MRLVTLLMVFFSWTAHAQTLDPAHGVVLSESAGKPLHRQRLCNRPMPWPIEGTWMPDPSHVRRLEVALASALQAALDSAPGGRYPKPVASGFYRQYLGLMVAGKRIIYINGLHEQLVAHGRPDEWRTVAWNGCDGGLHAFSAEYDVASDTVGSVIFNGGGRGRTG